ncbi:MAG TPA: ADP-forming succinate--CoA ligase subunit beta [Acidimicrobiia bacterium]|nr:ADP-forming succinate--CoA ligase subunit beta [Acidimicrobiia bacterium]HZQ77807.1 ADP-forming succinate--CoA ligase subunit beta [Acidimicrobiia bacterium]
MDLFEYQGKQLLARFGVPVSPGEAVDTVDDAVAAAERLGYPVVVKAQVQVGGRGKAGGIKLAGTTDEARLHASNILGMDIKGHVVRRLWVEKASDIAEEYYASFTLDRAAKKHLGMVSAKGGVDIEQVAEEDPAAIARVHIDPLVGIEDYHARQLVFGARLNPAARSGAISILKQLYKAFVELDADLVEVNPLILRPDGSVHALDAKVSLDDNAAYRHPEFESLRSLASLDPRERAARERGLNYIGLDGEVGIIGNGAGLVMSTLDVVNQAGGRAANFLDVGGGAGAQTIANALEVITADPKVRSVLINIFGGITRCDLVAQGILDGFSTIDVTVPVVVRLDGTSAEEGRAILAANPKDGLVPAATMLEAASRAVELAKAGGAGVSPGMSGAEA